MQGINLHFPGLPSAPCPWERPGTSGRLQSEPVSLRAFGCACWHQGFVQCSLPTCPSCQMCRSGQSSFSDSETTAVTLEAPPGPSLPTVQRAWPSGRTPAWTKESHINPLRAEGTRLGPGSMAGMAVVAPWGCCGCWLGAMWACGASPPVPLQAEHERGAAVLR